jgi:hypothetical protein
MTKKKNGESLSEKRRKAGAKGGKARKKNAEEKGPKGVKELEEQARSAANARWHPKKKNGDRK